MRYPALPEKKSEDPNIELANYYRRCPLCSLMPASLVDDRFASLVDDRFAGIVAARFASLVDARFAALVEARFASLVDDRFASLVEPVSLRSLSPFRFTR